MDPSIVNYDPAMDEEVAVLLNEAWARLRAMRNIYVKESPWPMVDSGLLARWREQGRLSADGTFIAQAADGSKAAIFSVSAGDEGRGTLHFFGAHPDHSGRGYGSRTLAAAEEYLRGRGMRQIVTERVDSRCPIVNGFLRKSGFEVPDLDQQSIIMLMGPQGRVVRPVTLPDDSYRIAAWDDDYLDDWVSIRNIAFEENTDATLFLEHFRNREDFDPEAWFFVQHRDRPVGIAGALERRNPDGSHRGGQVEWVAVLPEYRGKGLGEALAATVLNRFVQRDVKPVALITQSFRHAAVTMYEKLGFRTIAQLLRYRKNL